MLHSFLITQTLFSNINVYKKTGTPFLAETGQIL